MSSVNVEFQDVTGNWITVSVTENQPQLVLLRMKEIKRLYPDKRVRAVDAQTGALIDVLQ